MYYVGMSGADTENRGQGDNDVRDATSRRGEVSVFLKEVEQLKRSCQPDGLVKCHMKRCAHKIGRVHLCHDLICQPDDVAEPQRLTCKRARPDKSLTTSQDCRKTIEVNVSKGLTSPSAPSEFQCTRGKSLLESWGTTFLPD